MADLVVPARVYSAIRGPQRALAEEPSAENTTPSVSLSSLEISSDFRSQPLSSPAFAASLLGLPSAMRKLPGRALFASPHLNGKGLMRSGGRSLSRGGFLSVSPLGRSGRVATGLPFFSGPSPPSS